MKNLSIGIIIGMALIFGSISDSLGAVVTVCGKSEGYSYYFESPLTSGSAGWQKDGMPGGEFMFTISDRMPDILYGDAMKAKRSAKNDGATVKIMGVESNEEHKSILVVVMYEGNLEHYHFNINESGRGEVVWGQARTGGFIPKGSLFVAKCRK